MWILPKQLHTFQSAQDTMESESDLKKFCQLCEQFVTWRGKHMPSVTCFRRWKANSWMRHLSTRMLKPSLIKSFLEKYLFCQRDFLANHSVRQDLEKELMMIGTSIPSSVKELNNATQLQFSLKTSKELSQAEQQKDNQFSSMSCQTWKDWVTKQQQEYSLRLKSATRTKGKECSSLELKNYPTPVASDEQKYALKGNSQATTCLSALARKGMLSQDKTKTNSTGKNQELNPNWVEQLMGLTVGWTDLGCWEMDVNHK